VLQSIGVQIHNLHPTRTHVPYPIAWVHWGANTTFFSFRATFFDDEVIEACRITAGCHCSLFHLRVQQIIRWYSVREKRGRGCRSLGSMRCPQASTLPFSHFATAARSLPSLAFSPATSIEIKQAARGRDEGEIRVMKVRTRAKRGRDGDYPHCLTTCPAAWAFRASVEWALSERWTSVVTATCRKRRTRRLHPGCNVRQGCDEGETRAGAVMRWGRPMRVNL